MMTQRQAAEALSGRETAYVKPVRTASWLYIPVRGVLLCNLANARVVVRLSSPSATYFPSVPLSSYLSDLALSPFSLSCPPPLLVNNNDEALFEN
jgi:hypothetical protein